MSNQQLTPEELSLLGRLPAAARGTTTPGEWTQLVDNLVATAGEQRAALERVLSQTFLTDTTGFSWCYLQGRWLCYRDGAWTEDVPSGELTPRLPAVTEVELPPEHNQACGFCLAPRPSNEAYCLVCGASRVAGQPWRCIGCGQLEASLVTICGTCGVRRALLFVDEELKSMPPADQFELPSDAAAGETSAEQIDGKAPELDPVEAQTSNEQEPEPEAVPAQPEQFSIIAEPSAPPQPEEARADGPPPEAEPPSDSNRTVIMAHRRPPEQVVVSPAEPQPPEAPLPDPAPRTCAQCGTQQTHGQGFCINCGAPMATGAAVNHAPCPSCGAVVDQTRRFCTACGTPLAR